ncbi:MAG: 2TM domain-containing protein [Actinomycetota bacterium]|nr:2TM domain-containing protein [Actinomycetota bacterium]
MALLVGVWALSGADHFWPVWPMLGWGVGLVSRAGRGRPDRSLPGLCGGAR